jgi:catabolite regulation protein CreA
LRTQRVLEKGKAKAAIIRFMDQKVATARVTTEIQNDMNNSTRTRADGKDEITKVSQRKMIENLTEVTSSTAAGILRGVIVLERGYDQKAEAAWVKVGISKKTMAGAQSLKNALAAVPSVTDKQTTKNEGGGVVLPGSHVQRSEQKDW